MTSVEQAPIEWTVEGLLAEIRQLHQHQAERALAFILGAGASVSSKIPAGGDLAQKWLEECYQRECLNKTKRSLEDWSCIALGDADFTLADAASYYPQIFERRFGGDYASGYAALEEAMKDAKPGVGYAILAKILDKTQHRVVVTTNFDNLVADAMAIHARRQPLIVGHEALAGFAQPQLRRALVAKIHRDLYLHPKNDCQGVDTLEKGWRDSLTRLFQHYTPLVLGYGGNDGSLMGFLNDLPAGHIPGRLFWCYRTGSRPHPAVLRTIAKHNGVIIAIQSFDHFMLQLAGQLLKNFEMGQLTEEMRELTKQRIDSYEQQEEALMEGLKDLGKDRHIEAEHVAEGRDIKEMTLLPDLISSIVSQLGWREVELAAMAESDLNKRGTIYREGLQKYPKSAELAGNFANFLADQRHDYDEAEHYYRRALELDPNDPEALANFAHLRLLRRQGDDLAQLPAMLAQVITLAKGQASQALAEALLYGVLSRALGQHSPTPYLARLKRVLALGYPRGYWDFTPLFDAVLPDIDPAQAQHYRALGAAILDEAALPALGALPWWQAVPEADPFTLPEEDQQSN